MKRILKAWPVLLWLVLVVGVIRESGPWTGGLCACLLLVAGLALGKAAKSEGRVKKLECDLDILRVELNVTTTLVNMTTETTKKAAADIDRCVNLLEQRRGPTWVG